MTGQSLGTNIVMIVPGATTVGGVRTGSGNASTLTVADARAIERECPSVTAVTYMKRDLAQVTYGHENWSTAIQGGPPSYPSVRDWPVARGRFFVQSMTGRDYPMIMAVVLTYGVFLAIMNLVVDLAYGALDPRIRY